MRMSVELRVAREAIKLVDTTKGYVVNAKVEAENSHAHSRKTSNVLAGDMLLSLYVLKHGRDIDIESIAAAGCPASSPVVKAMRVMMQPGAYGAGDMFGTDWAASHLDAICLIGERLSIPKKRCPLLHELLLLTAEAKLSRNSFVEISKAMRLDPDKGDRFTKSVIAIARVVGAVPEEAAAREATRKDKKTCDHVKRLAILALGAMRDAGVHLRTADIRDPAVCSEEDAKEYNRRRRVSAASHRNAEERNPTVNKMPVSWDENKVKTWFIQSDTDKNGHLDEDEIYNVLKENNLDLDSTKEVEKQLVRAMIALFDTDGNGKLSKPEFLALMRTIAAKNDHGEKPVDWIKAWKEEAGFDEPRKL